jgi:hypothetical protein
LGTGDAGMTTYKVTIEAEIYVNVEIDSEEGAEALALDALVIQVHPGYDTTLVDKWTSVKEIEVLE